MNDEQNNSTSLEQNTPTMEPINTPLDSANSMPGTTEPEQMTTAVVNPNFMEEVQEPVTPVPPTGGLETPVASVQETPNYEGTPKKKGPNKVLITVIAVVAVLLLAIGGYTAYLFFGVSPKKMQDKVIDQMFATANNFASKMDLSNYKPDANTMKTSSTISFSTSVSELSILNNYALKLDTEMDRQSNYGAFKYSFLENNKDLLGLNVYLLDNKTYLESSDLYSKIITIGDTNLNVSDIFTTFDDLYNTLDTSDKAVHLLDTLKKSIKEAFNEDKYERKLETVKLNGKEVKAFNNSYTFGANEYKKLITSILNGIANDEESLEIIVDFMNDILSAGVGDVNTTQEAEITEESLKELITSFVQSLEESEPTGTGNKLYFNVYTSLITNETIGVKLLANDFTFIEYSKDGDTSKCKLSFPLSELAEGQSISFETSTKGDKTNFELNMKYGQGTDNVQLMSGSIESTDTKSTITLDLSTLGTVLNSLLVYNSAMETTESTLPTMDLNSLILTMTTEDLDNENNIEMKIEVGYGEQTYDLAMKMHNTVSFDESITKPNVQNAVPMEEVNQEELYNNLLTALQKSDLYNMIAPLIQIPDLSDIPDMDFNEPTYSEHCEEATNCKCDGDECICRYLNDDFKYEDITCPNTNI